jgi:hypothetical protein
MVASFEIKGTEERAEIIAKSEEIVTFSLQSQERVRSIMYAVWNVRTFGERIHWFDLGDYIGKAETK